MLFGPDKLPRAAVTAARLLEKARALRAGATARLTDALDPQTKASLREGLEARALVGEQISELEREAAEAAADVRAVLTPPQERTAPQPHPAAAANRSEHDYRDEDLP